jgi:excinuclease ABC subunit B
LPKTAQTISSRHRHPREQHKLIEKLEKQMKEAAKNLEFEEAMQLRDIIFELKSR